MAFKMNAISVIIFRTIRTYTRKVKSNNVGVRGRVKMMKSEGYDEEFDEFEDDLAANESDFMNVDRSYEEYKRDERTAKLKLKQRIVERKYFKDEDPIFLTSIEKDQIRKLHSTDPEEWTPERLSESFPILPRNVRKVLKSKWLPKSSKVLINSDKKVAENWEKFWRGELPVSPSLHEHLMKFKNRKISFDNREELVKHLVAPKVELPKPKSTLFSNIVKGYVDSPESNVSVKELEAPKEATNESQKHITLGLNNSTETAIAKPNFNPTLEKSKNNKRLTFDEFVADKLNDPNKGSEEEKITLIDIYRKRMEKLNFEDDGPDNSADIDSTKKNEKRLAKTKSKHGNELIKIENETDKSEAIENIDTQHSSLDTYVKERRKLADTEFNYVKRIKIPKNVYKEGMTYRIHDCYYDDDGEFLYRTPGLRN